MIKRTLYFGNPAYLSLRNGQMEIRLPEVENSKACELVKTESRRSVPIEDLGIVVLDNKRITITQGLMAEMAERNVAVLTCDSAHMPMALSLPLAKNSTLTERWRQQMESSLPLRKQMWQQTIAAKIRNQAAALRLSTGCEHPNMMAWAKEVRSGDPENIEGRAAAYYWRNTFPSIEDFIRGQDEAWPNCLLNYGYAIVRAMMARALVASGLMVQMGIHHRNKYNAYCLADDMMEPYRPFVDKMVMSMVAKGKTSDELTQEQKVQLLSLPTEDVRQDGKLSPMMVAISNTAASLHKCFAGESKKILFPELPNE